eukprot:scaffold25354_cov48-Phaeocystis_antarctica.AAC.1
MSVYLSVRQGQYGRKARTQLPIGRAEASAGRPELALALAGRIKAGEWAEASVRLRVRSSPLMNALGRLPVNDGTATRPVYWKVPASPRRSFHSAWLG